MFITIIVVVVALAAYIIKIYNKLQSMMQNIRESFANIQATLKKRLDLSNQIIDIAKDYASGEQMVQLGISGRSRKSGCFSAGFSRAKSQ